MQAMFFSRLVFMKSVLSKKSVLSRSAHLAVCGCTIYFQYERISIKEVQKVVDHMDSDPEHLYAPLCKRLNAKGVLLPVRLELTAFRL